MTEPVIKSLEVACAADQAFDLFVSQITTWWPLDRHAVSVADGKAAQAVTIEAKQGGAVYQTMPNGARADWGKVLQIEPGEQITMSWHPGTNADTPTQVSVTFQDMMEGRTRVTLEHSGWDIWGARANEMRNNYAAGWDKVLGEHYAGAFDGGV